MISTDGLGRTLEALLFLSPEPVSAAELAEAIEVEEEAVAEAIDELEQALAGDRRGIRLRRVAGGHSACTVDPELFVSELVDACLEITGRPASLLDSGEIVAA